MLSKLEIRRQVFHLSAGLVFIGLIYFGIFTPLIVGVIIAAAFVLSVISKRYRLPGYFILKGLDRPEDIKRFPGKGGIFYLIGVFIALLLFPKYIAMASVMILALGDSIAPLVGQYGKIRNPLNKKKFLEGSIAGIIAAGIGAAFFVGWLEAFLAAIAAMVVEGIGLRIGIHPIDDNITMPVVAGVVITVVRFVV